MATEACAERAHPPVTAWGGIGEGSFQNEKEGGTAEIAVFPQNRFAPASFVLADLQTLLQREENVAPTGMEDPTVYVIPRKV